MTPDETARHDAACARAVAWIDAATEKLTIRDPYAGAARLVRRELGLPADLADLVAFWRTQVEGCSGELRRYPWLLSYRRWINPPPYSPPFDQWQSWRLSERQLNRAGELSYWFAVPIVVCRNAEILEGLAAQGNPDARALLDLFAPVMRRDFARYIAGEHPWVDTFALWNLARTSGPFARLQPLAVALGASFAATARETGGVVSGVGFPYHEVPLASATAHLATGLLALGLETPLIASMLGFLAREERPSGGWGDGTDPEDLLTTFVAADLFASVDPRYDVRRAAEFILARQDQAGFFRVMGPEAPWLTGEIVGWLRRATLPFARRFRWPRLAESTTDSKTRLPGFGYFRAHAELCAGLPGLSDAPMELAFLDLAGFKTFNDRFGQDTGDEVIVLLAHALATIPDARAVRDGGDEFLIMGPPTDEDLEGRIAAFLARWPALFSERFGADAPVVAPRISITTGRGGALRELRENLGRSITQLKREAPRPGASGVMKRI